MVFLIASGDARDKLAEDGDEAETGADFVTRLSNQIELIINSLAETVLESC